MRSTSTMFRCEKEVLHATSLMPWRLARGCSQTGKLERSPARCPRKTSLWRSGTGFGRWGNWLFSVFGVLFQFSFSDTCVSRLCAAAGSFSHLLFTVSAVVKITYPARSDIMVGTVPSICTVVAAGKFCGLLWADWLFCFLLAIVPLLGCLLWLWIVHRHRGHKNRCSFCNLRRAVALLWLILVNLGYCL